MSKTQKYNSELNVQYKPLQKHLDSFSVGFPKTKSGVEYKILQSIYDVDDIAFVLVLTEKDEDINTITKRYNKSHKEKITSEELHKRYKKIRKNGGIRMFLTEEGEWKYALIPFLVGLYEYSLPRASKEWLGLLDDYVHEKFAINYLSTDIPQARVIPINKAIEDTRGAMPYDKVRDLIKNSPGPFIVGDCICKLGKKYEGKPCKKTDRLEVCMATGPMARIFQSEGWGKEITREQALEIQKMNEEEGLIMQVENTQEPEFFCACCECCCGLLHMGGKLPRAVDFIISNYQAKVSDSQCIGCGICEKACPMGALSISDKKAHIDLLKCIGCGICVSKCPKDALQLKEKEQHISPPESREKLYEEIQKNRRGAIGKYYRLFKAIKGKKV